MIELDDSRVYSTKEAAAELGITRTEVQRAIARGVLPFVDRGEVRPRLGVRGQDLRAFVAHIDGDDHANVGLMVRMPSLVTN